MAFPITFLDSQDIGREVVVTLTGGVSHRARLTGIHIVEAGNELEVSIDTDEFEDLMLQADTYVFYADDVSGV